MKSAGVITGKGRGHHALVESFGAMLIVLFASALAAAQSIARSADAGTDRESSSAFGLAGVNRDIC